MIVVSAALGLAYVNDTTRPQDVKYFGKILDKLLSFDCGTTSQRGISFRGCFASFAIFRIILLQERRLIVALSFCFNDILPRLWSRRVCHGRGRCLFRVRGQLSKTSPQPFPTMILGGNMPALFHYALDL
ncbi:hypothetical protein AMTRI_Chr12g236630 [Amborella trichopoda]